jgi:hypothetical protein
MTTMCLLGAATSHRPLTRSISRSWARRLIARWAVDRAMPQWEASDAADGKGSRGWSRLSRIASRNASASSR